jgi:hypothetical protein
MFTKSVPEGYDSKETWVAARFARVIAMIFVLLVSSNATADSLEVRLSLPVDEFIYGQEIYVEISVVNLENRPLTIIDPRYPQLLRIVDQNGQRPPGQNLHITFSGTPTRELAPLESFQVLQLIYSLYLASDAPEIEAKMEIIGEHTLRAELRDIVSNTVSVRIVDNKPADREIVDALRRASRSWFKPQLHQEILDQLTSILEANPTTLYKPELLFTMARFAGYTGNDTLKSALYRRLVFECPYHIYSRSALSRLVRQMMPDASSAFLDSVIADDANTRAADWVRRYRKSMGSE